MFAFTRGRCARRRRRAGGGMILLTLACAGMRTAPVVRGALRPVASGASRRGRATAAAESP